MSAASSSLAELAAVDMTVAGPVLEGNAELPAGLVRGGAGIGCWRSDLFAWRDHGPVARQPMRPVVEAQRPTCRRSEARRKPVQSRNRSAPIASPLSSFTLSTKPLSPSWLTSTTLPSIRLTPCASARCAGIAHNNRVEMIGVGDLRQRRIGRRIARRRDEFSQRRSDGVERIIADVLGLARRAGLQPILMEGHQPEVATDRAEAVDIAVTDLSPVIELDAKLEAALGLANELRLIDLEQPVESGKVRNGRFADPDDPDFFGFNQDDVDLSAERLGYGRGAHPAGCATADDGDRPNRALRFLLRHALAIRGRRGGKKPGCPILD